MKRIFGIFAALAVAMGITLVACHKDEAKNAIEMQIDQLVTDTVIKTAVKSLANDISAEYSHTRTDGTTWAACMVARDAVYGERIGGDWFRKLYASIAAAPEFDRNNFWTKPENGGGNVATYNLYLKIMDTARKSLDTPEELRAVYLRHKGTALQAVHEQYVGKEVRDLIFRVIPYFDGTASAEKVALIRAYHNADGWASQEMMYKTFKQHGLNIGDVRAWEFAERRRAEGGDALVIEYSKMLSDFAVSLGTPIF